MKQVNSAETQQKISRANFRDEPLAKQVISLRVPTSQIEIVKARGNEWIRTAIAEKLQRESIISIFAEARATQRLDRLDDSSNYTTIGEFEQEIDSELINNHLRKRGKKQISITN
jgi:hypothetical protein